jgi:hypothetical protein
LGGGPKLALGPTSPLSHIVPDVLSSVVKQSGHRAGPSPHIAKVCNEWSCISTAEDAFTAFIGTTSNFNDTRKFNNNFLHGSLNHTIIYTLYGTIGLPHHDRRAAERIFPRQTFLDSL